MLKSQTDHRILDDEFEWMEFMIIMMKHQFHDQYSQ